AVESESKAGIMAHHIADRYAEPLTLDDVARAAGLHPNYAMTCFKQTFGMTILEYTQQYRVAQAQRLLVSTDSSVLDVAMRSGFGSLSAFYTAFRRYTGQTPRSVRQALTGV
ncbi:MAG: helix-turn-helix transcriptional regulator, partial [Caldilineaceae bacterium]|nr:helix-turn-helix transcriptional regulator [Caldilineaceae bacterium]